MKVHGLQIIFNRVASIEGKSPAKVKIMPKEGKALVTISDEFFSRLTPGVRMFIILHELGHVVLMSSDEIAVDRWAFKQYCKTKYPLKEAVYALSKVVDPLGNGEHSERLRRQFNRCKQEQFLRGKLSSKKLFNLKYD